MALFPDRIVQKNSTDTRQEILDSLGAGGQSPIVSGELVVQRSQGTASLITLDAQGKPVVIGTSNDDTPVAPSIVLNFELDGTDTPYTQTTWSRTNGKFGSHAWFCDATLSPSNPRGDALLVDRINDVPLSAGPWTVEFWIKGSASDWLLDAAGDAAKYALITNKSNYISGPGAFNIYLDGGTPDRGGGGSNTSYTEDQAVGSVVFGISVGDLTHGSSDPLIPATGEVVSTRGVSVLDDVWHHVVISHEGSGIYSIFTDGQLNQRTILTGPIDQNDGGNSGIAQPSGWDFGGTLIVNDQYPDTGVGSGLELAGGRYAMDSFALYQGLAKYKGLYSFPLPTQPVSPTLAVRQPVTSLESLIDTDIPTDTVDGSILVYNEPSGSWRSQVAPPYSLTGNILGDVGDVTLPDAAQLTDLDFLRYDTTTGAWVNSSISLEQLGGFQVTNPQADQYLAYDTNTSSWVNQYISYSHIAGRPTALSDLQMNLSSSQFVLQGLGDVSVSSLAEGNVLVYDSSLNQWKNETAPAPDLSVADLQDLGDVLSVSQVGLSSSRSDIVVLSWDYSNDRWVPSEIDYADINGQPTALNQFTNNLYVGSFYNNVGYLTASTVKSSIGPEDLDNTNISYPAEGQVLVYRSGNWKNETGQPANIAFSSIGELNDVTYYRPSTGVEGEMTFEGMGLLNWDSPYQPTNIRFNLHYRQADQALGMEAIRTADDTGSSIHVSRGGGVDIRSDVNFIRLRGKPDTVSNRPQVRFETGDSFAAAATGEYIAFQMPDEVDESVIYRLPSADGDSGDVLATDGVGRLTWVARVSNNNLGALEDVDLSTELPVDGSTLVYNEAAGLWIPGESSIDLGETSINELQDVNTSSTPPISGQGLGWDAASSSWKPMDVAPDLGSESIDAMADVDTTTTAPTPEQALIWDGANWVPGDVQVDEASPAVIWTVSALGISDYVFEGPGFPEPTNNPNLYVIRGQNYTFNKTLIQHPFQVQEAPGTSQPAYTRGFTASQPLGEGVLSWVVPMDAPSTLYYQCTLHSGMSGVIYVLNEGAESVDLSNESIDSLQDVDTTTAAPAAGQALVWDGANWIPGNVVASGISGSAISQRATESQASDASGLITYVGLGTSGTMVSILSDTAAWVTLFATEAARTADSSREFGNDPQQGSGVLAEFLLEAGVEVLTSPSTNYFNANAIAAEELYALVRDQNGSALGAALVTINAYSISGYTAISGGTFGSG